jgi:hypothetical protein
MPGGGLQSFLSLSQQRLTNTPLTVKKHALYGDCQAGEAELRNAQQLHEHAVQPMRLCVRQHTDAPAYA